MGLDRLRESRLFVILAVSIFYQVAFNITRPTTSLYAVDMGASPFLLGLLVSTPELI